MNTQDLFLTPRTTYNYNSYLELIKELLAQNKSTSGPNDERYLKYAQLNLQRMERQNAHPTQLKPELVKILESIKQPQTWWVITEGWCGDAAQNLPVIAQIAAVNPLIDLKLILRDQNLDVIDQYLTNNGRSIPKLIFRNADNKELGSWGPRPQVAQKMLLDFKANPNGRTDEKFHEELHLWYMRDKNQTIQDEFIQLIQSWPNI